MRSATHVAVLLVAAMRRARRAEGLLHKAADAHAPVVDVAVRHAFAEGRKVLKANPLRNVDRAVEAIRKALRATLPGTLRKVLAAGGAVAAGKLRTAGDYPGHPFHGNQYTRGVSQDVKAQERSIAEELGLPTTYHGEDSSQRFAGLAVDNPLPQYEGLTHEETKQLPINTSGQSRDIDISKLESTQDYIQPSAVKYYKEGLYMKSQPVVATIHGHEVLLNGNHNVLAAKLRGEKTISVQHLGDFTQHADAIKKLRASAALRTAKRDSPKKIKLDFTFDTKNEAAISWADRHAAELIDGISETSREAINNAIADALETGDIADALDEILAAVGDPERARLIARNETMRAVSEGQRQAWAQAVDEGFLTGDERRTWITVGDEKVCPICEPLDGTFADLDGQYPGEGGDGPPAHVSCRCTEGLA